MKTNKTDSSTDFYILQGTKRKKPLYKRRWFWIMLAAIVCIIIVVCAISLFHAQQRSYEVRLQEMSIESLERQMQANFQLNRRFNSMNDDGDETDSDYGEMTTDYEDIADFSNGPITMRQIQINGHQLRVFTLPAGQLSMQVEPVDTGDYSILLAFSAANVSASDGEIVGTFVDEGSLLSLGDSPKGYCAIIQRKTIIGAAKSSPYLEEALYKCGYFFRQLPLVVDGMAIDNKTQGKTLRRALCKKNGKTMVIESPDISLHDFSRALVDYGVSNAIALGGGNSYGFFRTENEERHDFGNPEHNEEGKQTFLICQ